MAHSKRYDNRRCSSPAGFTILKRISKSLQRLNPLSGINWRELGQAYRMFIGNPGQGILHILAAGENSNWQHWVLKRLGNQAAALETATLQIDIPALLALPADTLGGAYSRHITQQGFDPEAFIRPVDRQAWLQNRLALSHDIYHVITGFDGTPVGEFGLAAFGLVQYRDLLNTFVLSFVPWSMVGFPRQAGKMLVAIGQGLRMGWRCHPIVAYPFEDNWHQPLWAVRRELGIDRIVD